MKANSIKKLSFISIAVIAGFMVPLVMLELLLRLMPIGTNVEYSVATNSSPYLHPQGAAEAIVSSRLFRKS